jgi:hypothetical protein
MLAGAKVGSAGLRSDNREVLTDRNNNNPISDLKEPDACRLSKSLRIENEPNSEQHTLIGC